MKIFAIFIFAVALYGFTQITKLFAKKNLDWVGGKIILVALLAMVAIISVGTLVSLSILLGDKLSFAELWFSIIATGISIFLFIGIKKSLKEQKPA